MRKSGLAVVGALALGGVVGAALAQAKPEQLVKQRQAVMTLQGKYFGPMAAMAQGKAPYNADIVRRNAAFLDNLSRMPWDGFDPSTKDVKSNALPAVFEQNDKFKEAGSRLENETHKLYEVSRSGDEEPEVAPRVPGEHRGDGASGTHKGRQTGSDDEETDDDETSDAPPHTCGERQQLTAPMHNHLLQHAVRLRETPEHCTNSPPGSMR